MGIKCPFSSWRTLSCFIHKAIGIIFQSEIRSSTRLLLEISFNVGKLFPVSSLSSSGLVLNINRKYSSMTPAPYNADLRWPFIWFVQILYNSVAEALFFIGICERTLERYISKFLVNGHVKPGPVSRSYGSIIFYATQRARLFFFFLHTKYGNHSSFRSWNLCSTTASSRSLPQFFFK